MTIFIIQTVLQRWVWPSVAPDPDGLVDGFEHSRLATTANVEAGFSGESEPGFHAHAA